MYRSNDAQVVHCFAEHPGVAGLCFIVASLKSHLRKK
jgi:hypothetical protein